MQGGQRTLQVHIVGVQTSRPKVTIERPCNDSMVERKSIFTPTWSRLAAIEEILEKALHNTNVTKEITLLEHSIWITAYDL